MAALTGYLIYPEADFEDFRPATRCTDGASRCTDGSEIWHGGGDLKDIRVSLYPLLHTLCVNILRTKRARGVILGSIREGLK